MNIFIKKDLGEKISMVSLGWVHVFLFLVFISVGMYLAKYGDSKGIEAIVCFFMICVAGLRHGYIDTRAYRIGFETLEPSDIFSKNFIFYGESKGKGFSVLSALIKVVTENSQVFLFIISFVIVGCLFWGIMNNVPDIMLGAWLFITTGCFLDTMNGIRQYLVVAFLFLFVPKLIVKKKLVTYIALILILSTIHVSALVFIPIYFIANKRAWSKFTGMLIIFCAIIYLFFDMGVNYILVNMLEGSVYETDYGQMLLDANTSVNIIRIFVTAVPIALAFMSREIKR